MACFSNIVAKQSKLSEKFQNNLRTNGTFKKLRNILQFYCFNRSLEQFYLFCEAFQAFHNFLGFFALIACLEKVFKSRSLYEAD